MIITWSESGRSEEHGIPSGSVTWVTETQVFHSTFATILGASAESRVAGEIDGYNAGPTLLLS